MKSHKTLRTFKEFEHATLADAERAREEGKEKKYKHLVNKVRNLRKALLKMTIQEEDFYIDTLPDDILGKEEHGKITIDEVVLNDYETLERVMMHEILHLEGIENDAIVEIIIQERYNMDPFYREKIQKLIPVIHALGRDFVINLYQDEKYSELFSRYMRISIQQGKKKKDAEKKFFEAFPELTKKQAERVQTNEACDSATAE